MNDGGGWDIINNGALLSVELRMQRGCREEMVVYGRFIG